MTWQKGQSGNPQGRRVEKPFRDAVMLALHRPDDAVPPPGKLSKLVETALHKAIEDGDTQMIRDLADRLDGKVPQGIIGGEESDPPIRILQTLLEAIDGRSKSISAAEPTSE